MIVFGPGGARGPWNGPHGRLANRIDYTNGRRMNTTNDPEPPTQESDLEAVFGLFAEGRPVTDPELIRRIRERSEAARQVVSERNGVLDIAVPYVRALRDGDAE